MWRIPVFLATTAFLGAACSGPSSVDSDDAGRTKAYEPGVPNFDMESIVRLEGGMPVVDVFYSVPNASLVFVQTESSFTAQFDVSARIIERETEVQVRELNDVDSVFVSNYDSTIAFTPQSSVLSTEIPSGDYIVDVTLTDLTSDATARRRQAIQVEAVDSGEASISRMLLEGIREGGRFEPILSLHVPSLLDSLRASVQLYNLQDNEHLDVTLRVVRFKSDTTIASPPFWLVPSRGSLAYRGIDFDDADTIQVSRRRIVAAGESAVIEFSLPRLARGIYRLTVAAVDSEGAPVAARERILSVKNPTFPSISMLDDLVDALSYIAFEQEIEAIQEARTPAEMKRRFDTFWGQLIPNKNLAANLIELYYGRIQEANLFFTGYKEGWKTDRGMVYTILGPPLYVDQRIESEVWHFSYGDRDPVHTFVFEKALSYSEGPFETYILQRRPYYQHEWSRAIDRWREGEVL